MDIINPNEVACICKGLLTDGLGSDILVNAVVFFRLGITDLIFNEREDRLLISVTATLLNERAGSPF
ncbi:hypothetical protein [Microbulbifer sp. PAAF003]|uniref:hypothetical protein n=1 Tax=Microbulbifer sp. PAAF003 TaxID=3243375 RepID=UPI004039055B